MCMNQLSLILLPICAASVLLFSCKDQAGPQHRPANLTGPSPDTIRLDPVPTEGAATYTAVEGNVYWSAKKAIGAAHKGSIRVAAGALQVNRDRLLGGTIALDMGSISVSNMDDAGEKATLESHLKDKDFFEVKKYPQASFEITDVLPSNLPAFNWVVRGNLTIKGKTNPVNIPVNMTIANGVLQAESASFIINRTQWGLNFRSGILGTAKDKIIEDNIPLSLRLTARAK